MTGNMTSTGRGGAGNIADAANSPKIEPSDLSTPHLKSSMITTGRGGSGNMAPNVDPAATRALQDADHVNVDRPSSTGPTHVGRGGQGNVVPNEDSNASEGDNRRPPASNVAVDGHSDGEPHKKGIMAKTKEFFKKP
ncbi:hypothetical protein F5Y15DRAFT_414118 [Xylariaceae sp. FL0016]|nr:hypothetical protein F5Y15DRAFT_414118 [Xylariaceae sp. FL0016]